jgi:UDP-N-acetylglucosamine--N-acetylmuramyl-(pentapeptide) pyrophosphoryl-undecaprenol N-acetylglucosamine transferase
MTNGRLMIMAGGTGGHLFPALAVAKQLRDAGADITWLGTKRGLESKVIPANNIAIEWISIEGLRGKGVLSILLAPFKLARAMWQSAVAIHRVQPDCILGMGGFVSGPGGLVARLMGRPLIVHEQNAVAGLTNKYLAKVATRVLSGFANVEGLPKSAVWVGNPVRETIQPQHTNNSNKLNVLIIGGSQGAHSFNLKLPQVFSALDSSSVSIWHQSGRARGVEVTDLYKANNVNAKVSEFIDDMAAAYAWADLLICRSGAMTIAECCAAAKPALLVPYPFSAGDHQQKNALTMVNVGAAKMVSNNVIGKPDFSRELVALLSDKNVLRKMGQQAHTLHKPNALRDVVAVCQEYLNA